jgi:hypothetical protein
LTPLRYVDRVRCDFQDPLFVSWLFFHLGGVKWKEGRRREGGREGGREVFEDFDASLGSRRGFEGERGFVRLRIRM